MPHYEYPEEISRRIVTNPDGSTQPSLSEQIASKKIVVPAPTAKTYVYEGTEVEMTGRTARKPSAMNKNVIRQLFEITPVDKEAISWKKWVAMEDLYEID